MKRDATSLGDGFRFSTGAFPERTAMLVREKDQFRAVTYAELRRTVLAYCAALKDLGVRRGDKLVILSENCAEWAYADWASLCLGYVVVPIYPTLPADQAQYIVKDCEAVLAIVGSSDQRAKLEGLSGVQVVSLNIGDDSLSARAGSVSMPESDWNEEIDKTGLEDLATIIYTSGTTGLPKGAMLPHRCPLHVAKAASELVHLGDGDTFLSFLPMSHVYERVAGQHLPILTGGAVAYSKSLMTLASDMAMAKPTIMLCVPRFLESFMDKAIEGAEKLPPLRKKLFFWALSQGTKRARGQFAPFAGILDKLVGAKLRERVGGRLRFFVSGGAALAPHVAEFYMAMGLTVLQGYGLTETTGGSCVNVPDRNKYWTAGESLGMEIKIADDGEILLRGPGLMIGYYKLPEETAKAIDADGWFHTGDIGEFEGKNLKITDRKKDLIVLGNGKNVAPQPIENKLKAEPHIGEAVVFGDGMEYCIALIVPNFEAIKSTFKHEGKTLPADGEFGTNHEVKALIKKEVDSVNKTLANFEMVKKHVVLEHAFTIEAGELTPTLKVKRKAVKERYAKEIASMQR